MSDLFDFNNLAGAASLVNSLIMWPVIRSLQKTVKALKTSQPKKKARNVGRNKSTGSRSSKR